MGGLPRLRKADFFFDPKASVAVHRQPMQGPSVPHQHDFIELVVIFSGQGTHVIGDFRFDLQAGDVLVIHRSRSHGYENTRSLNLVNILIREDVLRQTEREFGVLAGYHALFSLEPMRWRQKDFSSHLRLSETDLRKIGEWVDFLEEESLRATKEGRFLARSWLVLIMGLLSRRYGQNAASSPRMEIRLGRVLSWIEQHFSGTVRLRELSKNAAMSERTFLRQFRVATGFTPIDYLIRVRIRHAGELLKESGDRLNITEIAQQCGFEDSNYFSRQFRRIMGISPRAYGLRECLKTTMRGAMSYFGRIRGGETGKSPQWALTAEPTTESAKRAVAQRVGASFLGLAALRSLALPLAGSAAVARLAKPKNSLQRHIS